MRTVAEINDEIVFQEQEYDRIKALLAASSPTMSELRRQDYLSIASRHAARRQALKWAIS